MPCQPRERERRREADGRANYGRGGGGGGVGARVHALSCLPVSSVITQIIIEPLTSNAFVYVAFALGTL